MVLIPCLPVFRLPAIEVLTECAECPQLEATGDELTLCKLLACEHDRMYYGEFVVADRLHSEGSARSEVDRTWCRPKPCNGYFVQGRNDTNVVRPQQEAERLVTIFCGPIVWLSETGRGDAFTKSRAFQIPQMAHERSIVAIESGASWDSDSEDWLIAIQTKIESVSEFAWSSGEPLRQSNPGWTALGYANCVLMDVWS